MNKFCKYSFFSFDHLAVCVMIALLCKSLLYISDKVSLFDPMKAALDDFYITDVFFEILQSDNSEYDNDIIIVDMTSLRTRNKIAQAIMDIKSCNPKVLGIDLIFERPNFNEIDDAALISALKAGDCQQVLSCKLRDYSNSENSFQDSLYSFFHKEMDGFDWGYTNYFQTRTGGVTRETSQVQLLNNNYVFSFPYLLSCKYTGKLPTKEDVNERLIMYENIKFHIIGSDEILQNADKLRNKLVLFGVVKEEADMHFTPVGKLPGVVVMAYSALSYVRHTKTACVNKVVSLFIALLSWFIAAWVGYAIENTGCVFYSILSKIINFIAMVFWMGVSFEVFVLGNHFLDLFYPLLGLAFAEDVRELYVGLVKQMNKSTLLKKYVKKSLYVKNEASYVGKKVHPLGSKNKN